MVQTVLNSVWLWRSVLLRLTFSDSGSFLGQSFLLFSSGFWSVLVEQLEGFSSGVSVQSVLELSNGWRNLQSDGQDLLLSLQSDIFWPFDVSGQVSFWLDSLANTEVLWSRVSQWVLSLVRLSGLSTEWSWSNFLTWSHLFFQLSCSLY
ncbi:hypothetical protein WN66_04129 [Saccharomyces cerevisiae]|nr:hypothetical protein WN66_04129 [Saccharomyces cerevisiae]